jgi:hypothetical protein
MALEMQDEAADSERSRVEWRAGCQQRTRRIMLNRSFPKGRLTAFGLVAAVAAALTTSPVATASSFSAATAKSLAHTVFTAEEVYFTEHLAYTENKSSLVHLFPSLNPRDFSIAATHMTFTVSVRTKDGSLFRMTLDRDGKIRRTCSPRSAPGCSKGRW